MNISTGGPHILLFERDQQFTTLLVSELQLAGYECHTARTAVEVFDAIARYPVRLVLVNMAQAAAARREFWVALDTQRRGRGVQVMTFQCFNLAGYGAHDPEDRAYAMVDLQVDGMMGLMNLVEMVRGRIPGTNTTTRISKTGPSASAPSAGTTQPFPRAGLATETSAMRVVPPSVATQPATHGPVPSTPAAQQFSPVMPLSPQESAIPVGTPSYTDKIRAVLYPNQRQRPATQMDSATPEANTISQASPSNTQPAAPATESVLQRLANGQSNSEETGLAQLSRLVQEHRMLAQGEVNDPLNGQSYAQSAYQTQPRQSATLAYRTYETSSQAEEPATATPVYTAQQATPQDIALSIQPLRASPIEDLPAERAGGQSTAEETRRSANTATQEETSISAPPLASLSNAFAPSTAQPAKEPVSVQAEDNNRPEQNGHYSSQQATSEAAKAEAPQPPSPAPESEMPAIFAQEPKKASVESQRILKNEVVIEEVEEMDSNTMLRELSQQRSATPGVPNHAILDIVQSLPPMPAPMPQSQALNGRATRTLGSVLLEGHLVPQSRLEVAQNIQRMLRGVDLNYQLGEILLMFKLLTPDQLLAASLVSYGLISTQQIAALGRIRQELHAIGLEYDLENLLILFRILTPEQLREVRSGWQG